MRMSNKKCMQCMYTQTFVLIASKEKPFLATLSHCFGGGGRGGGHCDSVTMAAGCRWPGTVVLGPF